MHKSMLKPKMPKIKFPCNSFSDEGNTVELCLTMQPKILFFRFFWFINNRAYSHTVRCKKCWHRCKGNTGTHQAKDWWWRTKITWAAWRQKVQGQQNTENWNKLANNLHSPSFKKQLWSSFEKYSLYSLYPQPWINVLPTSPLQYVVNTSTMNQDGWSLLITGIFRNTWRVYCKLKKLQPTPKL